MKENVILILVAAAGILPGVLCDLQFATENLDSVEGECAKVVLSYTGSNLTNGTIILKPEYPEIATVNPSTIEIQNVKNGSWIIKVCGHRAGYTVISASLNKNYHYLHVVVGKIPALKLIADIIGWIYFLSWSVSFYPQIYENFVRKSVVGLNFDYLALNIVGFALYSVFNCGLYYVPVLQEEYFGRHPKGLNPVQFNDVFFSVHAMFATIITIVQCIIYERAAQKISLTAKMILSLFFVIVLVTGACAFMNVLNWLDFIYYCSYIKLSITLIKYIPQAVMNYTRKSTVGWSIGNIILDFVGGFFSLLQMLIMGYNYNDWENIFGDLTKFGLGVFSIFFDIFFMYQHYVLYRRTGYEEQLIDEATTTDNSQRNIAECDSTSS